MGTIANFINWALNQGYYYGGGAERLARKAILTEARNDFLVLIEKKRREEPVAEVAIQTTLVEHGKTLYLMKYKNPTDRSWSSTVVAVDDIEQALSEWARFDRWKDEKPGRKIELVELEVKSMRKGENVG